MAYRLNAKLCKCFYGPFPVIAKIGLVTYTLQLLTNNCIHPTFHVSQLKLFKVAIPETVSPLPNISINNHPLLFPVCILASRIKFFRGQRVKQVLVQWSNSPPKDATWENFHEFCTLYQQLDLEDKVIFEEGEWQLCHSNGGLCSNKTASGREWGYNKKIIKCTKWELYQTFFSWAN